MTNFNYGLAYSNTLPVFQRQASQLLPRHLGGIGGSQGRTQTSRPTTAAAVKRRDRFAKYEPKHPRAPMLQILVYVEFRFEMGAKQVRQLHLSSLSQRLANNEPHYPVDLVWRDSSKD